MYDTKAKSYMHSTLRYTTTQLRLSGQLASHNTIPLGFPGYTKASRTSRTDVGTAIGLFRASVLPVSMELLCGRLN